MSDCKNRVKYPERDPVQLRCNLWRAANMCRRSGLKRAAVIIAGNLHVLADSLAARVHPLKQALKKEASSD